MNEEEEKRWLLERIETYLEISHQEVTSEKEDFHRLSEKYISNTIEMRNHFLAGVGFAATVFLGLAAINIEFIVKNLIVLLIVDVAAGLAIYVIVNFVAAKATYTTNDIWWGYYDASHKIDYIRGYVIGNTLLFSGLTLTQMKLLSAAILIAVSAADALCIEAYRRAAGSKYVSELQKHFLFKEQEANAEFKSAYENYKNVRDRIKKEAILEKLLPIIEPMEQMYLAETNGQSSELQT